MAAIHGSSASIVAGQAERQDWLDRLYWSDTLTGYHVGVFFVPERQKSADPSAILKQKRKVCGVELLKELLPRDLHSRGSF
jgi:hypothetical protein